jgi:formylglycine-generating enzyme required for sulfatase activity
MIAPRIHLKLALGVALSGLIAWGGCTRRHEWTGKVDASPARVVEVRAVDAEAGRLLVRQVLWEYQVELQETASSLARIDAGDSALRRFASELETVFAEAPELPERSTWAAQISEKRRQLQVARAAGTVREPGLVSRFFGSLTNTVVRSDTSGAFRLVAAEGDWILARPDSRMGSGPLWPVWVFRLEDSMKPVVLLDSAHQVTNAAQLADQLAHLSPEAATLARSPSTERSAPDVVDPALAAWIAETRTGAALAVSNSVRRIAAVRSAIAETHAAGESIAIPLEGGRPSRLATLTLRWIPPGTFAMGSPPEEADRDRDEALHTVLLKRGFYLAETECTQAQWLTVNATQRSGTRGDTLPVTQITWSDARAFCVQLTARQRRLGMLPDGWRWDLPTESQWEYACRAGTAGAFAGDLDELAWHAGNSKGRLQPVKTRKANGWGLHDMHGNVAEWCRDWYGDYPLGMAVDPAGPDTGTVRIYRGGNLIYGPRRSRSAIRGAFSPGLRGDYLGFRPALVQDP